MNESPRLSLPLLIAGQGQKDVTHNESLLALDFLVQPVVLGRARQQPPETPEEGDCWLIPSGATGEWSGHEQSVAGWTAAGWRYLPTAVGWSFWVADEARLVRRGPTGWAPVWSVAAPLASVAAPSGGTVVDAEARAAISLLISRLAASGLIES